jgi:hypothetical protein
MRKAPVEQAEGIDESRPCLVLPAASEISGVGIVRARAGTATAVPAIGMLSTDVSVIVSLAR